MNFIGSGDTPVIEDISVYQEENEIKIDGKNYNTIEWIADGKVIATGYKFDLNDYENDINDYVRAQLIGDGGISFTQPFGVNKYTIENLKDLVEKLEVSKGIKNSLIIKLDNAEKSIKKEKSNSSSLLNAFTNELRAKSGKEVSVGQVNNIIHFVDEIILNLNSHE